MADDHNSMSAPGAEKQKQLRGELYHFFKDPQLLAERDACRELLHQFNNVLPYADVEGRRKVLTELLGGFDSNSPPHIEPPIHFDFGKNTFLGKNTFINFNCTILDCNVVKIGNRVLFGPNVQLYPASHPTDPAVRQGTAGPEFALPITIEDDVWIGGGVIVLPGVTIGKGATVGAGSVVTKNVEPYTVVAGNPARFIRRVPQPGQAEQDH
jgi:maltose O-acetyltransferase